MQPRRKPQLFYRRLIPYLPRQVGGKQITPRRGAQTHGAQSGHGGNKPVYHRRQTTSGGTQKHAAHGSNVQPAHLAKRIQHVAAVRLMQRQRRGDDPLFQSEALVGHAAAPTGDALHAQSRQRRLRRKLHAHAHGMGGLLAGHGRLFGKISRAGQDLAVYDGRTLIGGGNAYVHHLHLVAEVVRHGAHAGEILGHVHRLRRRDAAGRDGHPLLRDAVIGAENDDAAGGIPRVQRAGNAAQADINIFQLPQTAGGLGQRALIDRGASHGFGIRRSDMGKLPQERFLVVHGFKNPSSVSQRTFSSACRVSSV